MQRTFVSILTITVTLVAADSSWAEASKATEAKPEIITIPLAATHDAIGVSVAPGSGKQSMQLVLELGDGGRRTLNLNVHAQTITRRIPPPTSTVIRIRDVGVY